MLNFLLFFFLALSCNPLLHTGSISEKFPYPKVCQEAADHDAIFAHFKRNPSYTDVLEHVTYQQGLEYLQIIQGEYPDLLPCFDKFRQNDLLGDPIVYDYGQVGCFSPTTLRYIKVAGDLKKEFGDLSHMHIVEIGGGYGGQCKILSDLFGFASYTLIDLPSCNALSKKYLDSLKVKNVFFLDHTQLSEAKEYDLIISNYAFTEMDRYEQKEYLDKVIAPTRNGYMTCNSSFSMSHVNCLSVEELLTALSSPDRLVYIEAERPLSFPSNVLMLWKFPKS